MHAYQSALWIWETSIGEKGELQGWGDWLQGLDGLELGVYPSKFRDGGGGLIGNTLLTQS